MGYYITKTGVSGKTVYWTGGVHWSDDISKKKIPAEILDKIGQPTRVKHVGIANVKYDLTPYGIFDNE